MTPENTFDFSQALAFLKVGRKVGRKEWKNARFVFLVDGSEFEVNRPPLNKFYPEGTKVKYRPHIDMCGADGSIGTWSPSMVDLMTDDWYQVEDEVDEGTGKLNIVSSNNAPPDTCISCEG